MQKYAVTDQCSYISGYYNPSEQLQTLANEYLDCNPYQDQENFIYQATLASYDLPRVFKQKILSFKLHGNPDGFLHFRNLPQDIDLMDTPYDLNKVVEQKCSFFSEFWLAVFGGLLGEPFSYVQENRGILFHNVRPTLTGQDKLSSESSSILLDFHTECAFHPHLPDYLLLYCLRGDRNNKAATITSSIGHFKQFISPGLEAVLRQPLFKSGIDYSFGSANGLRGNGPTMPILYGDTNNPLITFDPDLMLGLTREAEDAIQELKKIMDKCQKGVVLQAGDLIIIDNRRALHGRSLFEAYFDGKDRWLQRLYVTRDLMRATILFSKNERILTYDFKEYLHPNNEAETLCKQHV